MKRFIEGQIREQVTLLPECLDDFMGIDNPVHIVDVFVEELDLLSLGFNGLKPAATGHPAYHPAVLSRSISIRGSQSHSIQPSPGA